MQQNQRNEMWSQYQHRTSYNDQSGCGWNDTHCSLLEKGHGVECGWSHFCGPFERTWNGESIGALIGIGIDVGWWCCDGFDSSFDDGFDASCDIDARPSAV